VAKQIIAQAHLINMHISVLLNLRDPITNTLKRPPVRHVINKQDALSPPEITRSNRPKAFLSRSIPNLKLDPLPVHFDVLDLEIDPDGGDKGGGEGVVGVTEEEASFAHT
jgi:hypothetical protein